MVEYRVLSTFVSRRLNTDLKDFTFDLWKKRGTMKTVKICSGNIDLREVNIDLKEVNIGLRGVWIQCEPASHARHASHTSEPCEACEPWLRAMRAM